MFQSTLIVICLILIGSGFSSGVVRIGEKREFRDTSDVEAPQEPTVRSSTLRLGRGQQIKFGPLKSQDDAGNFYHFCWTSAHGDLQSHNLIHSEVTYTAPSSGVAEDDLVVWIASESGKTYEARITVLVQNAAVPNTGYEAPVPGQISAIYDAASTKFPVTYSLGAAVTRAWILASTNGVNYSQVASIDPVTSANRAGTRLVTVSGSNTVSKVYIKVRTQVGTAAPTEGGTVTVAYIAIPSSPKSTEIPTAPNLVINDIETGNTQVEMFWHRVNDSLHQDNVVHYDLQYADNPDFASSTLINAGNSAAGQNIYESISYTVTGLQDDNTYYFRVRGVNYAGTGAWSNVRSIRINVQERPVFDASNPVFPPNGATGISKTPSLEVKVADPEGDPIYCAFEISESPTGAGGWRYFGHGGQSDFLNVTRLVPDEWGDNPLKPNTKYYWRARVWESGRNLNYYGGTWPNSPVYEFTTADIAGALSLSNVTWVSGELRPNEPVTYRLNVTNTGNERTNPNFVTASYVKNGIEYPFGFRWPGGIPALDPGQSTTTEVVVKFRDSIYTSNDVNYDNVIITGPSTIRFKTSPYDTATPQASLDYQINYVNQGGPAISLIISGYVNGSVSSGPATPLGSKFNITANITDDIRTTRVTLAYRISGTSSWVPLDDFTGNTAAAANFQTMTHSTGTTPWSPNNIYWTVPAQLGPMSTLQLRVTAYDDVGMTTIKISEALTVYDSTFLIFAGATEFTKYRMGDVVRFPLVFNKAPGISLTNITVDYWLTATGPSYTFYNHNFSTTEGIPPMLSVTIPPMGSYVSNSGFLKVTARGTIPGIYNFVVKDATDGVIQVEAPNLPAPFNQLVNFFDLQYAGFPVGAFNRIDQAEAIAMDWESDTKIHSLVKQSYAYSLVNASQITVNYSGNDYYHVTYEPLTGVIIRTALPSGYDYDDLKVFSGGVYALARNGFSLYWTYKSGAAFVTPQYIVALAGSGGDTSTPEFAVRGTELFACYSTKSSSSGSSTWRNRMKRLLPSAGSVIEQPTKYYGDHVDYSTCMNGVNGLYALSSGHTVSSTIASWSDNSIWFSSLNANVAGAYQGLDRYPQTLDYYTSGGVVNRWGLDLQNLRVKVFPDVSIASGYGTSLGRAGEEYLRVILRRDNLSGTEDRIKFGEFGLGMASLQKRSAISDGKWVALSWSRYLAVGNMGGDISAPSVQLTTSDESFVSGIAKQLDWTMSDNLNQLASVKVYKIAGGVSTQIATYTSGTLPTSLNYTFTDTVPSLILRVEAYDQRGNRGVAEKVLMRSITFSFSSFTAASYTAAMGTGAQLQWTATPVDALRIYNIFTRPVGGTTWTASGSATGASFLLDTTLLSGSQEVRVESGGVTRDLAQPLVITGNWLAFDNTGFSPASGTAFVAASVPTLRLNWASNQAVSPAVSYTVMGRWNGAGSYTVLGGTSEKSLEVNTATNTTLEWKVVAQWEGLEFASAVCSVTLGMVAGGPAPVAVVGGRATAAPCVELTWADVPGAEAMVVYRRDTRADTVEELTRVPGTSYRDEAVTWGSSYSYSLATVLGENVSMPGPASSVTISPLLPLGVTLVNANYQIVPDNANTVSWNPVLPAGVTAVYEEYQVHLRRSDGVVVASDTVVPESNNPARVIYTALEYNQSYAVEVFSLHPDGSRLNTEPVRLHFSTGSDNRSISAAPAVATPVVDFFGVNLTWTAVTNADYYDIFRRTNGGALVWVGRSSGSEFADMTVPTDSRVGYLVRARNSNTYTDSVQSVAIVREEFRITSLARTGAGGQDIALTFPGYPGATYCVQQSTTLAPDSWIDTGISAPGAGNTQTLTVPAAVTSGSPGRNFFRVVAE